MNLIGFFVGSMEVRPTSGLILGIEEQEDRKAEERKKRRKAFFFKSSEVEPLDLKGRGGDTCREAQTLKRSGPMSN